MVQLTVPSSYWKNGKIYEKYNPYDIRTIPCSDDDEGGDHGATSSPMKRPNSLRLFIRMMI